MKTIRLLTAIFMFIATISLTVSLIANDLPIQATGVFCMGTGGLLAVLQLIMNGITNE